MLPRVDDDAVQAVVDLKTPRGQVDLLAPPWAAGVVAHAIESMRPRFPITVYGLETYVSLRLLFTGIDIDATPVEKLKNLLWRYAFFVRGKFEIGIEPTLNRSCSSSGAKGE